ncbi:3-hydroxybutyrate dehydrogenase [Horticoccus luteus]|uniref:3-hydroxybutyrate dehydrogenase n=1 Tax=Horticoccus luteus TaxID=2862869 RepID=A0A8F9XM36_9BACT|nr:3-hydroxybutyrate dehydrogenase [Horticoccus luteus]QYM79644.1 3-hydroxybutyrate dehydrogenase [Horticoccus luteus]
MLRGKTALVTGSTSGIGWAVAQAFAQQGMNVMLHGLGDPDANEALRARLEREAEVRVKLHSANLAEPAEAERLVIDTASQLGGIDILVNNAGIQFVAAVEEFPPERWTEIQNVVLNASFRATRAAVPEMRRRGWGRILNIASAHGVVASPFKSAYVAAKHAQVGLTKSVALELAETGITCNAICPGYVRTPLVENQIDAQAKVHGLSRERVVRDVILAAQPTKRFIEVEEVAALAVFLCGDMARSITGAAIAMDGGWTAR